MIVPYGPGRRARIINPDEIPMFLPLKETHDEMGNPGSD